MGRRDSRAALGAYPEDLRKGSDERKRDNVYVAVFAVDAGIAEEFPSRLKRWMKVKTSTYAHPAADRMLYATR